MFTKNIFIFSLFGLAVLLTGCPPAAREAICAPLPVSLTLRFIVENRSSAQKELVLSRKSLMFGSFSKDWYGLYENEENSDPAWFNGIGYNPETEDNRPSYSYTLPVEDTVELSVFNHVTLYYARFDVMSFVFSIDGEYYAGWPSEYDQYSDINPVNGGLGYLVVKGKEFSDARAFQSENDFKISVDLPPFMSELPPQTEEYHEHSYHYEAVYRVTITDEGAEFVLDKVYKGVSWARLWNEDTGDWD